MFRKEISQHSWKKAGEHCWSPLEPSLEAFVGKPVRFAPVRFAEGRGSAPPGVTPFPACPSRGEGSPHSPHSSEWGALTEKCLWCRGCLCLGWGEAHLYPRPSACQDAECQHRNQGSCTASLRHLSGKISACPHAASLSSSASPAPMATVQVLTGQG